MNATDRTKLVLCDHGSKLVRAEIVVTGHKPKVLGGYAVMKDALFRADGAVAHRDAIDFRLDLKADSTTVTTSMIGGHFGAL